MRLSSRRRLSVPLHRNMMLRNQMYCCFPVPIYAPMRRCRCWKQNLKSPLLQQTKRLYGGHYASLVTTNLLPALAASPRCNDRHNTILFYFINKTMQLSCCACCLGLSFLRMTAMLTPSVEYSMHLPGWWRLRCQGGSPNKLFEPSIRCAHGEAVDICHISSIPNQLALQQDGPNASHVGMVPAR